MKVSARTDFLSRRSHLPREKVVRRLAGDASALERVVDPLTGERVAEAVKRRRAASRSA
jgi:hypothetical protein